MKKLLVLILLTIIYNTAKSQLDSLGNYADTAITLTLTQRAAVYIGFTIKHNQEIWPNRNAPTQLRNYIGSGNNLDSVFSVAVKASYITQLIQQLLTGQNEVVQADRISIINNSPSIPGYIALTTQIVAKANGSSSEKNVAIYVRDYYNSTVSQLAAARQSLINQVVIWSRN